MAWFLFAVVGDIVFSAPFPESRFCFDLKFFEFFFSLNSHEFSVGQAITGNHFVRRNVCDIIIIYAFVFLQDCSAISSDNTRRVK